METNNKKITIKIEGLSGSGSLYLLYFIKNVLRKNGFNITHVLDDDFLTERDFNEWISPKYALIEKVLKSTTIDIEEICLPPEPKRCDNTNIQDNSDKSSKKE
jgi:hypothetical protein